MHECNNNCAFLSHSSIYTAILDIHCFFFPLVYKDFWFIRVFRLSMVIHVYGQVIEKKYKTSTKSYFFIFECFSSNSPHENLGTSFMKDTQSISVEILNIC